MSTQAVQDIPKQPAYYIPLVITVAALGYFVDVYDLVLFSVLRQPSLESLGYSGRELLDHGVTLLNMQMLGMLLGGILWGVWGDKRGRVSVLFGSILLYSIANIANGMVQSVEGYAIWRFLAGIGLAGELGAGITLVSEIMHSTSRGWGTTIVATVGVAGALAAALVGTDYDWRTAYYIGGAMGLALLVLRVSVHESGLFQNVNRAEVERGNLLMLFKPFSRFVRYLSCIVIGIPTWFAVGIVMTFSPELGPALGVQGVPHAGTTIFYGYIGIVLGDLGSGVASQLLRSRRKAIFLFQIMTVAVLAYSLCLEGMPLRSYYYFCAVLGFAVGFWAVFVTTAAEQFGTNLRATVTTSVPNFVRGSTVLLTLLFRGLIDDIGIVYAMLFTAALVMTLSFFALYMLEESFDRELDYLEK